MKIVLAFAFAGMLNPSVHAAAPNAPDLDLSIQYYHKVSTTEGVVREARYEEKMLRRLDHVWVERIHPTRTADQHNDDLSEARKKTVTLKIIEPEHKHFNHVIIPRHVVLENNKPRVEYIDAHDKTVIAIAASEFENVNFDGSWANAYYLLDPKLVKSMPLSIRASPIAGAQWHEREKNGVFQRVLWDEQKQIPRIMESGDKAGTFYQRVDVKPLASLTSDVPWKNLKGYAQKEYSDFLD